MRGLRALLRRRWQLLAGAALLTLAAGSALLADLRSQVRLGGAPTPTPSPAQPLTSSETGRLEFFGAARNLFSSRAKQTGSVSEGAVDGTAARSNGTWPQVGRPTPVDVFTGWDKELDKLQPGEAPPLSETWLSQQDSVYKERNKLLRSVCKKYDVQIASITTERTVLSDQQTHTKDLPTETIKASHFTVVSPLKTLTCLVNKVASTSLLSTFLKLTGHGVPIFTDLSSPHSIAKVLHPKKRGELDLARKQYFRFMFVRHPLERLISAYEDKVVLAQHPSLLRLRKSIIQAHEDIHIRSQVYNILRLGVNNETEVLEEYDRKLELYRQEVQQRDGIPTFHEFLDFVLVGDLTGDGFDSHWTPYWRQCAPCHMDYDVIGKLETGADDFKYVWKRMKIYNSIKIPWTHQSQGNSGSLEERIKKYLSPLSRSTVNKFKSAFQIDFELFDYDWPSMMYTSGHCIRDEPCDLL